jgi:hypothetical protein
MDAIKVLKLVANGNEELLKLLKGNVLPHMVYDVTKHKNDTVSFSEIHDYSIVNSYEKMDRAEIKVYDLFNSFRNDANACKSLLHVAQENPEEVTLKSFNKMLDNQSKHKPESDHNLNQIRGYKAFRAILTEEQYAALTAYADKACKIEYNGVTSFDCYHIDTEAQEFAAGDFCIGYNNNSQAVGYTILQSNPKGLIQAVDLEGMFVVTTGMSSSIAKEGEVDDKIVKKFKASFEKSRENAEELKQERLDIRAKELAREEERRAKLEERAKDAKMTVEEFEQHLADKAKERAEKKVERENNMKLFKDMKLDSLAACDKAAKKINKMDLSKSQLTNARQILAKAREALKAGASEAKPKAKKAKAKA